VTADGVYVAGGTGSPDFPGTAGGAQGTNGGYGDDAFVAKLDLTLTDACASNVTAQASVTRTAQVSVTRGGFRLNRATGHFVQTLRLENTGATSLQSPVSLTLDGLSGNAALYNQSGTTSCAPPLGSPYLNVNVGADNALTPGEVTTVNLEFDNPTHQGITYTPRVLAASGDR
jgi:hypothetical protein